jgi:hypothetical protein
MLKPPPSPTAYSARTRSGWCVGAAGLLVGDAREDHVAREAHFFAREPRQQRDAHGGVVLHVDGAAAPQAALGDRAGERRVAPLRRVGLDHVEVRGEQERCGLARASQARDHVGAARGALQDARLEPGGAQLFGAQLGGGPLVAGRVGGVDAQEALAQIDGVVAQRGVGAERGHRRATLPRG